MHSLLPSTHLTPHINSLSYFTGSDLKKDHKGLHLSSVKPCNSVEKKQIELKSPTLILYKQKVQNYLSSLCNADIHIQKNALNDLLQSVEESKTKWTSKQCWWVVSNFTNHILKINNVDAKKALSKIVSILKKELLKNNKQSWSFLERFFLHILEKNDSNSRCLSHIANLQIIPEMIAIFNSQEHGFTNQKSWQIINWLLILLKEHTNLVQGCIAVDVLPSVMYELRASLDTYQKYQVAHQFLTHLIFKRRGLWPQSIVIEGLSKIVDVMKFEMTNKQFYMILVAIIGNEEDRSNLNLTYLTEMVYHIVLALNPSFTDQQCKKFSNHLIKIGDSLAELNNPNNLINKNYMSKL